MKKPEIKKEHRALIESVIRESPKFRGHEELIDLFCEAIYKKSYLIIDAIRDMSRLRRHLLIISDSCMDYIIKEKQRFEETKIYRQIEQQAKMRDDVVSLKRKTVLDERQVAQKNKIQNSIVNLKEEIQRSEKYDAVDVLIDPLEFCPQKRVSEHTIEKLIHIVKAIDSKFPSKKYYDIFSLRYIRKNNQTEIAQNLKISQVELSKRFVELIKLVREVI